jgi:hypothetical protein
LSRENKNIMDIETIRHDQQVDMEYNTSRERMIIPEYGRNVQRMVDYLLTLEDRDERNKQAQNLIAIIANLNPQVYETDEDPDHKLWDRCTLPSARSRKSFGKTRRSRLPRSLASL